jgi:glycosyltransferase involved in cell wall biosynthesis
VAEVLDALTQPLPSGRLFTVGIPVYNGRSLLRNCLHSVVSSTFPRDRFEVVVVDDGSSEPETLAILDEFDRSLAGEPGFFRVISEETNSGGAARPRNRVLDEATGEYVFFVDADDTIGALALARIAEALASTPADWVAVNQVPVNGRGNVCRVRQPRIEVPRARAMNTLTVHKLFRRAEIERQHLRFDVGLPSGQDVSFAFSYILNASTFLMLGGYDYYYLTRHADNPNEPAHLSRRADTPKAVFDKNERILRSMLADLDASSLPDVERREIACQAALHRVLVQQGHLKAIVNAGPVAGTRALRRLSELLSHPLLTDLETTGVKGVPAEQLAAIVRSDWARLAYLVGLAGADRSSRARLVARSVALGRRLFDVASGRTRHRRVVGELEALRQSVDDLSSAQHRLEASMEVLLRQRGTP